MGTTPGTLREQLEQVPAKHCGTYLVMVPHYWGRGATLDDALAECRKSGGKTNRTPLVVYWQSHEAAGVKPWMTEEQAAPRLLSVNQGGALCWYGDDRPEVLFKA